MNNFDHVSFVQNGFSVVLVDSCLLKYEWKKASIEEKRNCKNNEQL